MLEEVIKAHKALIARRKIEYSLLRNHQLPPTMVYNLITWPLREEIDNLEWSFTREVDKLPDEICELFYEYADLRGRE